MVFDTNALMGQNLTSMSTYYSVQMRHALSKLNLSTHLNTYIEVESTLGTFSGMCPEG